MISEWRLGLRRLLSSKPATIFVLTLLGVIAGNLVVWLSHQMEGHWIKYHADALAFDIGAEIWRDVPVGTEQVQFALIDIDDATFASWGGQIPLRRDYLAELLRVAVNSGSAAVILDVELYDPTDQDDVLRQYLASLDDPDGPPVFMVHEAPRFDPQNRAPVKRKASDCMKWQPTPFDDATHGSPQVHWVAYGLLSVDKEVRHLRYWDWTCQPSPEGAPASIPSLYLSMAALFPAGGPGVGNASARLKQVRDQVEDKLPKLLACNAGDCSHAENAPIIKLANGRQIVIANGAKSIENMIRYSIFPASALSPRSIPANQVIDEKPDSLSILKDRVVVIGATHAHSADTWNTPHERMPGPYLIFNAIHSLVNLSPMEPLSEGTHFMVDFLVSLLASTLVVTIAASSRFAFVQTAVPLLICAVVIPMAAIWYWGQGIWIDATVPAISAFFHHKLMHIASHRAAHAHHEP